MSCVFSPETIDQVIDFHGHYCPGLSIGIRVSELAYTRLRTDQLVCITETDMCGVDAIQFLTDCSLGKGNLITKDLGKVAFTFYNTETGEGFRAIIKPEAGGKDGEELRDLTLNESRTPEEDERLGIVYDNLKQHYLQIDLEDMFDIQEPQIPLPRPAKVLASITCDHCGEKVMESRIRLFDGKKLCIPCFEQVEQKI